MSDVAVIILTFNEERNLPPALDSVSGWASEVFVVDSYSTDRTVRIALDRHREGVQVVQNPFDNYSQQWNWALDRLPISASWTLKLDADERVTPQMRAEIDLLICSESTDFDGVYFPLLTHFMGQPVRWGGFSSTQHLRLWRTGSCKFERRSVNEHAIVNGPTIRSSVRFIHNDQKPLSDWLLKHGRYSSLEARGIISGNTSGDIAQRFGGTPDERRMWWKHLYRKVPFRSFAYFIYRYVLKLGFLSGVPGFRLCFLHASYLYWIDLKIAEYRLTGELPRVNWPERGDPDPALTSNPLEHNTDTAPRRT